MTRREGLGILLMTGAWGFADGLFTAPSWGLALGVFACGAALFMTGSPHGVARRAAFVLGVAAAQAVLMVPLPVILSHVHEIPGLSRLAALVLQAAGIEAGVDAAGRLLLPTDRGTAPVSFTSELIALPTIARLAAAAVMIGPGGRARWGTAILLGSAGRLGMILAMVAAGAPVSGLFEPAVTVLSFLPMLVLTSGMGGGRTAAARALPSARRTAASLTLLALAAAAAGAATGWHPPGSRRGSTVLIDESHSNWEWTDIPFDSQLYGQRSLYNYALWKDWIELHHETRVIRAPVTDADLESAGVLVIKTPTSPYDPDTVRRIEQFVRKGGGLWLIGDHTNLYGMSSVLNRVAAPYGLSFAYDDLFPLDHESQDRFEPGRLWPHPLLRGIDVYSFETSCSLRVPWGARHVMLGRRLASEDVDYGHTNFFGDIRLQASERFGVFTQAAALAHGAGRVVAFSDSTNFSNFSMLWPGRRELVSNTLDWLDRTEPPWAGPVRLLLPAMALLLLVTALLLGVPAGMTRAVALWACLGIHLACAAATSSWCRSGFTEGPPRRAVPTIAFDTSVSRFDLPVLSPVMTRSSPTWLDFNAFFINAARTGRWPEASDDLEKALLLHDAVVVVLPVHPITRARQEALGSFFRRGGRLLLIDSVLEARSAAAEWAAPFGFEIQRVLRPLAGESSPRVPALAVEVRDGVRRKVTASGAVLAWRDVGKGRMVVMLDGALSSDRAVGGVYATPDPYQTSLHLTQAEALELLIGPVETVAAGL